MRHLLGCLLLVFVVQGADAVDGWQADPDTGLAMAGDWQLVKAHCSACHSTRLVTQNRGSRETWLALFRWMQDSQGLWAFDPDTEERLLTYLATYYPPLDSARRGALDASLMPPNPHETRD